MKWFTHYEITSPLTYIIHFFLKMLQITRNFVTFRNVANHAYLNGKKCVEELNIFHIGVSPPQSHPPPNGKFHEIILLLQYFRH